MKIFRITVFTAAVLLLWVVGCDVSDPGSSHANQPPTTTITSAPQNGDTVNHYIELRWAGNDADGQVAGFQIWIDGEQVVFTTATDTTIAFAATTDGDATEHTFRVVAVDNEDLADPDPRERQFFVTNFAPSAEFADGSVPSGVTVGYGFQMVIEGLDENRSLMSYSIRLGDDQSWTDWSSDSLFLITDTSLGMFPPDANVISNAGLGAGELTVYARVKDAGDAVSETVSRVITVADGFRPVMDPLVSGAYGIAEFYPDGSVYRRNNVETQISFSASAAEYYGSIHSYQYLDASGGWSEWMEVPSLVFGDLTEGEYPFSFTARDLAGEFTDTISYEVRIVEQQLTNLIVMIDETRDGNGNLGSPEDAPVDSFYMALVEGYEVDSIDYANRDGGVSYISPYDLRNAGLIIWYADDFADRKISDNTDILTEYLNKGGRMILSGWDLMGAFTDTDDSASFNPGSFVYEKLRIFDVYYNSARTTTGIIGNEDEGYPNITVDEEKLPGSFGGSVNKTWTFNQRGECIVTGTMDVGDPETNPNYERTAAFYYDQSFRVAVFGVPLFFCVQSEVKAYFDVLLPRIMAGL